MTDTQRPAPSDALSVKVYPYRPSAMGNIIWPGRFEMRYGKFPPSHPIGGGFSSPRGDCQCGDSDSLNSFRDRGYWASCFPEGDGITWRPERGQSDDQCIADIRDCFGWRADWGVKL